MLTQTLALLLDAYRELNAKKLFWITMILSGVIVLAFAAVGKVLEMLLKPKRA